jgi:cystathionine beta-lyase/cystathionine gamma-synthase
MPLLDVAKLIPALAKCVQKSTYLILDNSTRSITCQPYMHLTRFGGKLSIVVVESLNKFHQYGFDRVTGGMIQAPIALADDLFRMRMHLGTNIPVASILALPEPNRVILEKRIARIGRNTELLAHALESHLATKKHASFHVVRPQNARGFAGGFFVLAAAPGKDHVSVYDGLLTRMIAGAKKRGLNLIAGTSFGFDITRVYVTARYAREDAEPFVRISPGTENLMEIGVLQNIMIDALDRR